MKTRTICIAGTKGGTGRTTTACNVGLLLGKAGYQVLLVDLDPQCSLTFSLLHEPTQHSLHDAFLSPARDWTGCVVRAGENVSLMPCSPDASRLESLMASRTQREETLVRILRKMDVMHRYDVIIFDCPSSAGLLTVNAMAAATDLYVTTTPETLAIRSLAMTEDILDDVRGRLNPSLHLSGIIVTRYNESRNLNRIALDTLRRHYGDTVFGTVIRENVKISEAPQSKSGICDYAPESNGCRDYVNLTNEIIKRLENQLLPAKAREYAVSPEGLSEFSG